LRRSKNHLRGSACPGTTKQKDRFVKSTTGCILFATPRNRQGNDAFDKKDGRIFAKKTF